MRRAQILWIILLLFAVIVPLNEARGGRGRGGGSFGGLFGGWRKYKKPASSGSGRRIMNSSPSQSTIPKPVDNSMKLASKQQTAKVNGGYPKQQMPNGNQAGYGHVPMGAYYSPGGAGAAHLPPGSQYYASPAAMPAGAVYYAQPPMQSSGTGNFLMGMMTGHMLHSMLHPRPYVSHVYHQQPTQQQENQGQKVIIINTGNDTTVTNATQQQAMPKYWPTDTVVPLAPLNETLLPADTTDSTATRSESNQGESSTAFNLQDPATASTVPAQQGIICMPMLFNETDPNDSTKTVNVEKVVCFPAPPPPPPQALATSSAFSVDSENPGENCVTGIFVETDADDPTKTIEVRRRQCRSVTLTPEQIVGEISENTNK